MRNFKDATMKVWTVGADAMTTRQCEVRLGDHNGQVEVTYEDEAMDDSSVSYEGQEQGEGHYLLECESLDGRASLHRFSDSLILEGFWKTTEASGMWRVELGKVTDTVTGVSASKPAVKTVEATEEDEDDDDYLLLEAEDEDEDDDWSSKPRRYRFPLRSDWDVNLRLPDDMTRREGKRMAAFIKSLSCEC
jgi:hypothetical protein